MWGSQANLDDTVIPEGEEGTEIQDLLNNKL